VIFALPAAPARSAEPPRRGKACPPPVFGRMGEFPRNR